MGEKNLAIRFHSNKSQKKKKKKKKQKTEHWWVLKNTTKCKKPRADWKAI